LILRPRTNTGKGPRKRCGRTIGLSSP
jgi:hypothetical protein